MLVLPPCPCCRALVTAVEGRLGLARCAAAAVQGCRNPNLLLLLFDLVLRPTCCLIPLSLTVHVLRVWHVTIQLDLELRILGSVHFSGSSSAIKWGISSIFGSKASSSRGATATECPKETFHQAVHMASTIQLREPPSVLRPREMSDNEAKEIIVTKLLVKSYFDIVRKKIQDSVPKAIMCFLVNHTKNELHTTFMNKLYRESLFDELLQEQDEVVERRKHVKELLCILREAVKKLNEV
ncbi:hypothetical protein V6N13_119102 [Hibiscus sabdariffa]